MSRIFAILIMIFIFVVMASFIMAMILTEIDAWEKRKQRKKDNEFNNRMIEKCEQAKKNKICPKHCKSCA